MTDTSDLKELLQRAADDQPAPSPLADIRVAERCRRRQRRRRCCASSVAAAVVVCGGLAAGLAVTDHSDHSQTVSVSSPQASTSGTWRISGEGLALLHRFAQPDGQISDVAEVQMKETTWANYVIWASTVLGTPTSSGYLDGSPIYTSSTRIYVILQVGAFNCATIYGCNGHHYNSVVTVTEPGGQGELTTSVPDKPSPSLSSLPGPEADLNTKTGQVTTTASPTPGTPTVQVPSVVAQSAGSAAATLENLGFSTLERDQAGQPVPPSEAMTSLRGRHVTAQDPPAGSSAPAGSPVTITLSS